MEPRIVAALWLSAVSATGAVTAAIYKFRQTRADRRRRRGIKDYNSPRGQVGRG